MPLERTTRWGVDRADLLRAAKIDEAQLRDPDARIPLSAIVRLWHAAALHLGDPSFGLRLGCDACARELGLVGYTMAFSNTVGTALTRLARYDRIVSDTLVVHLDDSPEGVLALSGAIVTAGGARDAEHTALTADIFVCGVSTIEAAGPGFLDRLRREHARSDREVPAIALLPPGASEVSARAAGFQHYFTRPVDRDDLCAIVWALSRRGRLG